MSFTRKAFWVLAWALSITAAGFAGMQAYKNRVKIRSLIHATQAGTLIQTNLYALQVQKVAVPTEGRDGGIAPLGDGVLVANRNGKLWFVDKAKDLHALEVSIPVNVSEFASDPYNQNTVSHERFGVKDILVQNGPYGVRLLASYNYWHSDKDCYALRVSSLETTQDQLLSGGKGLDGNWRTVFETTPCRTLNMLKGGKRAVTIGAGGRLAALSDNQILLAVGGFGAESEAVEGPAETGSVDDSYGKTVLFDLVTGQSRIFTRGHRNPQGLAVGSDARVWSTEHGPKGGDELNRLLDGKDYGAPHVTYGTEYGMMTWPGNPQQGRHEGYEKPTYAWVPSVGVSQLIAVERDAFPYWKGDLIASTLKDTSLYRVRIEGDRAVFAEPIQIGHRIRDIIETADGTIVLKTDDNFLVYLAPASELSASQSDAPARGELLASQCQGCHTFEQGGASGLGPNLWGIVGRKVASADGFVYSDALRASRSTLNMGRWTPEALRSYIANPGAFAPGTTMELTTTYNESQVADLVAYLETLK